MRYSIIVLCCLLSTVAFAVDLTLKNGDQLTGYMVVGANAKGIQIAHAQGLVTVTPDQLPDDVRETYAKFEKQYEKAKAKAAKDAVAQAAQKKEQAVIAAQEAKLKSYTLMFYGKISQVGENGAIAYYEIAEYAKNLLESLDMQKKQRSEINDFITSLSIENQQYYKDELNNWIERKYPKDKAEYNALNGLSRKLQQSQTPSEPLYISDISGIDMVDGTLWHGKIYRIGTHKYTTVMGAGKTVAKYTASREKAIEYYNSIKN